MRQSKAVLALIIVVMLLAGCHESAISTSVSSSSYVSSFPGSIGAGESISFKREINISEQIQLTSSCVDLQSYFALNEEEPHEFSALYFEAPHLYYLVHIANATKLLKRNLNNGESAVIFEINRSISSFALMDDGYVAYVIEEFEQQGGEYLGSSLYIYNSSNNQSRPVDEFYGISPDDYWQTVYMNGYLYFRGGGILSEAPLYRADTTRAELLFTQAPAIYSIYSDKVYFLDDNVVRVWEQGQTADLFEIHATGRILDISVQGESFIAVVSANAQNQEAHYINIDMRKEKLIASLQLHTGIQRIFYADMFCQLLTGYEVENDVHRVVSAQCETYDWQGNPILKYPPFNNPQNATFSSFLSVRGDLYYVDYDGMTSKLIVVEPIQEK